MRTLKLRNSTALGLAAMMIGIAAVAAFAQSTEPTAGEARQLDLQHTPDAAASPAAQQLPGAVGGWFYAERLARLDQRIAEKVQRLGNGERSDSAVIEAQKKLLLIARRLLAAGRDGGEDGCLATLYGLTIADAAEDFDKLTDTLPQQVSEALSATGEDASRRMATLTEVVQAVRNFNAADDAADDKAISGAAADALDAYLRRVLSPLIPVAQKLKGGHRIRTTWAVMNPAGTAAATPLPQHLKNLARRMEQSKIDKQAADQIGRMIDLMSKAAHYPDMRPRTAALAGQVEQLIEAADALSRLNWLDEKSRDRLNEKIRTAATLMMDPSTRDAGNEHVDQMESLTRPAAMLTAITQIENMPIGELRQLFAAELVLHEDGRQAKTAEALDAWIAQLAGVLVRRHQPASVQLPLEIRKVIVQLQQQYNQLERQTLGSLAELAAHPQQVTQPQWTQMVAQMISLDQQMSHLSQIPDWARRMQRINPSSVSGLYKQYLLIGQDLLKPNTAEGAAAALNEMDRQLSLFEHMPGEDLLAKPDADMVQLLGNQRAALMQQLILLRSQWAAAWGAGIDPTPAGRKLLLMRRLMSDLTTAAALPQVQQAAAKLNRWAAWQAPVEGWAAVQAWLIEQLKLAQQQAADDKWDDLANTLQRADAAAAALGLVSDLSLRKVDSEMDKIGDGFSAMLSQCLYAPGRHAFAADRRRQLAQWCVYLTATADADARHPADRAALARQVGELAIPLRAALIAPPASP